MQQQEETSAAWQGSSAFLVLGMHRSGTSAVAGFLDRLGVTTPGEALPPAADNPKGFFENKVVVAFHDRLLDHLGSLWDDPLPISNAFVESVTGQRFVAELAGIVERELLAASPAFAVKDPRMCRFIPLWKAALAGLGTRPLAVVPLRNPLEVAASLAARNKFPRAKSFLLWLAHILAVERETRGLARSFVSYDSLLADWRGTADKLARDLDFHWPKERGRVEDEVDEFLTRDLRHHDRSGAIGEGTHLDALVSRAWDALNRLVRNEADAEARRALGEIEAEVNAAAAVVGPYVAWEFRTLASAQQRLHYLEALEGLLRKEITNTGERLHAEHRRTLVRERAQNAEELATLRAEAARADWLHGEVVRWMTAFHTEQAAHQAVLSSSFWRLSGPLRRFARALPPSARRVLRRSATAGWWILTPWRMPARMEIMHHQAAAKAALGRGELEPVATVLDGAPAVRPASDVQRPLGLFDVPEGVPRVSVVTDSIGSESLFGGVATALIFSALLAQKTGRKLRIVTRTHRPDTENVAAVFRANGVEWKDNIDFAFADVNDEENEIDQYPDEWFVTASWWGTRATLASVPASRIIYLLQEDERMFYGYSDNYLNCMEIMAEDSIKKVVNSQLLYSHLKADAMVAASDLWFEPAFPSLIYYNEDQLEGEKKNFFFYARPGNERNLYERGFEVLEKAITEGILDPSEWNIHFVGKDLQPTVLAGGVRPTLLQNMPWGSYAAYIRSVDLALTLMLTPHPSYPPLDVAACGGVAVTNRFGLKTDLSQYSRSIICANSDVDSLVEGLRTGVERALDRTWRVEALADSRFNRNWADSFEPVFARLLEGSRLVR